jgi:hypothetical protein
MIFNQQQQQDPVTITEQGKNAIIAEMQEAIKLLDKPAATTDDLIAAIDKSRFVRNLMNLYLRDAFGAPTSADLFEQPNPMGPFGSIYPQSMQPQYPGQQMGGMMFNGMGMGYQRPPVDPMQHAYNNIYGGQANQPRQQQRTSQQVRWADFGADKLIYSTVVPVPNVAPGVHTLIIRIADKPAPGAQLTPAAELDMYARTIRIFNHDEVLTADRLRVDGIKGMLEELTYEYIIGDKPFPHFSNEGMLLWNAVKQQPDQYYNWKVLNNRGEELTTIQLDHKDEA